MINRYRCNIYGFYGDEPGLIPHRSDCTWATAGLHIHLAKGTAGKGDYKMTLDKVKVKIDPIATDPTDSVNHPKHYTSHPSGVECIQVTRHMNFNIGNVIKYCWRTDHKNGLEDLRKARWYLDDEINRLEQEDEV